MTEYYEISFDPKKRIGWLLRAPVYENNNIIGEGKFTSGNKWENEGKLVIPVAREGIELPLSFSVSSMLVIRDDLYKIFKPLIPDDEVQYIPVEVEGSENKFYILNAIKVIDCIDENKSEFTLYPNPKDKSDKYYRRYTYVSKTIIDLKRTNNSIMFRTYGWLGTLIVHKKIKDVCEQFKCPDLYFKSVT